MEQLENFLTVNDVAHRVGLTSQAVRYWIKVGKLKAVKISKNYFIKKEDLEAFKLQEGIARNEKK